MPPLHLTVGRSAWRDQDRTRLNDALPSARFHHHAEWLQNHFVELGLDSQVCPILNLAQRS
jgi:hypothetical protein